MSLQYTTSWTGLPVNGHTECSCLAKPPTLPCHQLQKQWVSPPLGKAGHDEGEVMKEDRLPWLEEAGKVPCLQGKLFPEAL